MTQKQFILAHDLGTTGNKASLYTGEGKVFASVFFGYKTSYPRANWVAQNPEDWWTAVCVTSRQLLQDTRISAHDIACVVFSGQMMGCVAVDAKANPLCEAIIWADQRGTAEMSSFAEKVGGHQALYSITGHRASPSYSIAKILWLRKNQPEIFNQTHKFLQAKDFVIARMTGNFITDCSDASGTNLFDLVQKEWSPRLLDAAGLDWNLLPDIHFSTDVVGELTPTAAKQTGLDVGTPVIAGGGDGACATVGAGLIREGSAYNYIGTSAWIGTTTHSPVFDPQMRTVVFCHLIPGLYSPMGTMQSAGGSYQWLRETVCLSEKETAETLGINPYDLMNLQADQSPPGSQGLLFMPYLVGERTPHWNPNARGAFIGLTMNHTRQDMIRSVLEGVAFNLRSTVEILKSCGVHMDAMRVIGGGAKSKIWRQIMADIYQMPVHRPELLQEATSLGAAVAGGVGIGLFKDFSIAETLTPVTDIAQPDETVSSLYNQLYPIYCKSYSALVEVFDDLAGWELTKF